MTTRKTFNAVFLAVMMVLSVVAIGAGSVGAASTADQDLDTAADFDEDVSEKLENIDSLVESDTDETAAEDDSDDESSDQAEPGTIDPALEDAEGETKALVYLDPADVSHDMSPEAVREELQAQADRTQGAAVDSLESMDGVEVRNEFWIVNALAITYDADQVSEDQMAAVENVVAVTENPEMEPPEPITEESDEEPEIVGDVTYGLDQINAPDFWDQYGTQGDGATIVIQDDGFQTDHEALEFEEAHQLDGDGNIVGDPAVNDHGTHVAGTAAGGEDPEGVAIGVAPDAELHGHDIFTASDVVGASIGSMQIAVEEDADVVSGSWGSGCNIFFPQPVFNDEQIDPIHNTRAAGVEVVSSAGNAEESCVGGFANDYESFAIGASDQNEAIAEFSSGSLIDKDEGQPDWPDAGGFDDPPEEWPQSWVAPHVAAPGVDTYSAVPGDGYTDGFSGTSMASPHVAGSIALLQSATDEHYTGPELREALEQSAFKPDDWDEEEDARWTNEDSTEDQPGIDSRYGFGIIDVEAAIDYLDAPPEVADELVLGDVTQTGEVDLADAVLIQERVACDCDLEDMNEDAADLNRNTQITLADAILVEEKLVGTLDEGAVLIDDLDAPTDVSEGDTLELDVNVSNPADEGAIDEVEFRLAPSGDELDENATVANQSVDMAVEGVVEPVAFSHEETLTLEVDSEGLEAGTYEHGVFTDADNVTDEIEVLSETFEVTDLTAPEEADDGDEIEVEAEIENTGTDDGTQDVEFVFAGEPLLSEEVSIDEGDTENVTFTVPIEDIPEGEYEHGVETEDDAATAMIDIFVPSFDVVDIDGPADADHGDDIELSTTIENTGGAADEQFVQYDIEGATVTSVATEDASAGATSVAVVGADATTSDEMEYAEDNDRPVDSAQPMGVDNLANTLQDELGDGYAVETVADTDLEDSVDDYDIFVINDLSADADLETFKDERDDEGIVYLENWGTGSDAISDLSDVRNDPESVETAFEFGGGDFISYTIEEDHALFEGVGSVGDEIDMYTASDNDRAWFTGYSGDILAEGGVTGDDRDGPTVGIDEDENEVLLTLGRITFAPDDSFTDEANTLLANAVEEIEPAAIEVPVELESGENETVEFNATVTEDDGVGMGNHLVTTEDDVETAPLDIDSPERIDVVDLEAPADVTQGDEIEVNATVEHAREDETTQDVEFIFDDEVVDSEEVTLDEGEEADVSFELEVGTDIAPGTYDHGVAVDWDEEFATIDVIEADDPEFTLSDTDLPPTAGQGENVTVTADVENVGDLTGEQTIVYEFLKEEEAPPGDDPAPPEPDADGIAVVDDERNTDQGSTLVSVLEEEYDDVELVTNDDLLDEMDEYEVFVIQRLDSDALAEDFLDELTDNQGAVYMDSHQGASSEQYPDGVYRLHNVQDDPAVLDSESIGTDAEPAEVTITDNHPIFDDVGDQGDTVVLNEDTSSWGSWFDDYSGDVIADVDYSPSDDQYEGAGIAVNDADNEVLMNALSYDFFSDPGDITDEGEQTLINAVGHASAQADGAAVIDGQYVYGTDSHDFDEEALDAESASELEIQPNQFEIIQTVEKDLELEGGEADEIEIDFEVPLNQEPGMYVHSLSTDDDSVEDDIEIRQTDDDIGVSAYFLEPDPDEEDVVKGETLEAEAVVINDGDRTGDFEVKLLDEEEIVDSEVVELEPDEVKTVDLEGELENAGERIISVNGVDPIQVDVLEPAAFEVSDLDPETAEVEEGEEFEVSATVTNTGEATDEKDVELRLDGDTVETEEAVELEGDEETTVTFEDVSVEDPGEYTHSIWTEDDEATGNLTVLELATFEVSDLEPEEAEVEEGEEFEVSATVTNTGDVTDEKAVELRLDGNAVEPEELVELEGDESETVTFEDVSVDEAGEYVHSIWTEDDEATGDLTVQTPAEFEVSDLEPEEAEVEEGEEFEVSATVENTGEATDEKDVELRLDGDTVETEEAVELEGDEETTVTFEDVSVDEPGEYEHSIWTEDDEEAGDLTVLESASFEVSDLEPEEAEVEEDEEFDVSATVTNTGEATDEKAVELRLDDDTVATQEIELEGDESEPVTFEEVSVDEAGDYEHSIWTEDDEATGDLTVQGPADLQITEVDPEGNQTVEQDEEFQVEVTVENEGDLETTQDVGLSIGPLTTATEEVTLDGDESETVTLSRTVDLNPGDYDWSVSTDDDETPTWTMTVEEESTSSLSVTPVAPVLG